MKVLLLNPAITGKKLIMDAIVSREIGISSYNYIYPPIGLAYIGSLLENFGHTCQIVDGNLTSLDTPSLIRFAQENSVNLVIIQVPSSLLDWCIEISNELNKIHIDTIFVGSFVTTQSEVALRRGAKYVVRGEPEHTILELITAIEKNSDISSITGLSYAIDGTIKHTPERPLLKNLDNLPFPARHLLKNEEYFVPFADEPVVSIITSRGCPHRCIFCPTKIYFGNVWRPRSIKNVIDEITECIEKFKLKHFCFWDDTFNVDIKRAKALCKEIIQRKIKIKWFCLSRVDKVDYELLTLMKKAGCYNIQFGVESASQQILDNIKKDITIDQVRRAFTLAKDVGIETTAFFMFGNPGETEETIKASIDFAKELDPDYVRFSLATPFPGTKFFEVIDESAIQWDKSDLAHSVELGYISPDVLEQALKDAYRSFYFRPKVIFREIFKLRNINAFKYKLKQVYWLIKHRGT